MLETAELGHAISKRDFELAEPALREALVQAQYQLLAGRHKAVVVLLSGVAAGGRGETAKQLAEWMDPRHLRVQAFGPRTPEELARPLPWRYWRALPPRGHVAVFMNAWYAEALQARVSGKLDDRGLDAVLHGVREYERMLAHEDVLLLKFWIHLSKQAQLQRLAELDRDKDSTWRVTEGDWNRARRYAKSRPLWEHTLRETSIGEAPWYVVEGSDWRYRDLTVGNILLDSLKRANRPPRGRAAQGASASGRRAHTGGDRQRQAHPRPRPRPGAGRCGLRARARAAAGPAGAADAAQALRQALAGAGLRRHRRRRARAARSAASPARSIRGNTWWCRWPPPPTRSARIRTCGASGARCRGWAASRSSTARGTAACWSSASRACAARATGIRAYGEINGFESDLVGAGAVVCKFWLQISKAEQLARFRARERIAFKRFKITEDDWRNRKRWPQYERAVADMVERSSTELAPWTLVEAEDKRFARVKVLRTIADRLEAALEG